MSVKIVCMIRKCESNSDLIEKYERESFNWEESENALFITLLETNKSDFFILPNDLKTYPLSIVLKECGSQVVCGLKGEKLRPYYISRRYGEAKFSFRNNAVVVIANGNGVLVVKYNMTKVNNNEVQLKVETIWETSNKDVFVKTDSFDFGEAFCYKEAIEAALIRDSCIFSPDTVFYAIGVR